MFLLCGLALPAHSQTSQRHPQGHPSFGLPIPEVEWLVYSPEPDHPCNQLWRSAYLVESSPDEVGAALPSEGGSAEGLYKKGWYFKSREGLARDRRLFGGDGRQLPREGFSGEEAARVRRWLDAVDEEVARELMGRPRAAVWFQHDLFRLARRLIDTGENPELLVPLLRCAERVALPEEVLRSSAVGTASVKVIQAQLAGSGGGRLVEIERTSSVLFEAEQVQLWSSVFVRFPDRTTEDLVAWLGAGADRDLVPLGALAVLVQGIVAMSDEGAPVATDLVIEARTQRLTNRDELSPLNPTTTRDGVDLAIWSLPRRAVRDASGDIEGVAFSAFRAIDMESQDLFRDYGTLKHTTYAAQCALCHRRSNTPDEGIGGFSA
ncbi:MAG: hypothetical protein MK291_02350, partial [Planctomycetes bacterium]|nr:hypothetical protein [Planctomycetota bacterium]